MNLTRDPNHFKKIRSELPDSVALVAVTKHQSAENIEAIIAAGATIIGENRVQEAQQKFPHLKKPVKKHLIGHLQTNKVRQAIALFDMIQSVDSLKLAKKIDEICKKQNHLMPILVQVNIAHDSNKYGFSPDELIEVLKIIGAEYKQLQVKGLMTLVPQAENPEKMRPYFKAMKELFEATKAQNHLNITMEILSMGMSDDHLIAVEEGSTMVRIGRKLFEEL